MLGRQHFDPLKGSKVSIALKASGKKKKNNAVDLWKEGVEKDKDFFRQKGSRKTT